MANESNITTSSHTIDTNVSNINTSNYTGLVAGFNPVIDKWYIGEKAKDRLKNDLFSALEGHEYKVKIEHADIVIDGVNKKGYHLVITNNTYTWYPTWYSTPTFQRMEITC